MENQDAGNVINDEHDREIVREFMKHIRPLDLLVFNGHGMVSDVISRLEHATATDGGVNSAVTHVEVAITRAVCPQIKKISKKLVTNVADGDNVLFSWGSTMSAGGGVCDLETGKPVFGVQIRILEDLLLKYYRSEHANVGVCRLINNPADSTMGTAMDTEALAHRMSVCYAATHGRLYNANPAALLGSMFPMLRPLRSATDHVLGHFNAKMLFCSELAAHIYIAAGVITDATDGSVDGKILNPADVVPSDFLGGDADHGLVNRICDDPIWLKHDSGAA